MSAMEKVNNILGKLPFVKLAGNIPEGIRGKIPVLNTFIPFANHIAVILAAVVLVACFGGGGGGAASPNDFSYRLVEAYDFDVWKGSINNTTVVSVSAGIRITDYSGNGGKVVIPDTIEGYPVVAIGHRAFMGSEGSTSGPRYYPANQITEIVMPDTVEFIDGLAFFGCQKLKSINLPASLKHVDMRAFDDLVELENLTIPDSLSGDLGLLYFTESEKLPLKTRARIEELR